MRPADGERQKQANDRARRCYETLATAHKFGFDAMAEDERDKIAVSNVIYQAVQRGASSAITACLTKAANPMDLADDPSSGRLGSVDAAST